MIKLSKTLHIPPLLALLLALSFMQANAAIIKSETFEDQSFNNWILTNGPRSIVTNHARSGTYSGKHTLIGQVGVQAGYKNESWQDRLLNDVGEYWIGFSVYIVDGGTEDWIFDQYSHDSVFFQVLHAPDHDLGESGKGYPIKMHIRGDEFTITHGGSTVNPHTSSSRIYTSSSLGTVTKGMWHDFVLFMKFDPPNPANCAIKVWHNGTLKVDKSDFVFGNEGPGYHVKFGIYQPDWRTAFADVDKRWIYHDDIRVGDSNSSYAEVEPGQGGQTPPPGGFVQIINKESGRGLKDGSTGNIFASAFIGNDDMEWELDSSAGSGFYYIINKATGRGLKDDGSGGIFGSLFIGNDNMKWSLDSSAGGNYVYIINKDTGRGLKNNVDSNIFGSIYIGNDNMKWLVE